MITEQEGEEDHAALISKRLEVPFIIGVEHATRNLLEGELVTMQLSNGTVHRGTGGNLPMKLDTML